MTTTTGGADPGGGARASGQRAPFVDPAFYRTPQFPYASLAAQLQDALGLAGRGAGGFTNMASPLMQSIMNRRANLGGGLLGMNAYARGAYTGGGGSGGGGGGGGGGAPYNPGPFRPPPGSALPPPPPGSPRYYPGGMAPTLPGLPGERTSRTGGLLNTGGSSRAAATGIPGVAAGGATLPYTPGAQFDPGSGETSVKSMLAYFNSLPQDQRGNYINAIDQYSLGKGGASNLGAALQQALRGQMGQSAFDQWYASNVTNKQGSSVGRDGLPPWLLTALGG